MINFYQQYAKRIVDVVLASTLIVAFSWLIVAVILVYVITFQFPIFFVQKRIGRNETIFTFYKFRTLIKAPNEIKPRPFGIGRFLRSTSLDELPQLFIVLKGDMSLIGPRPLPDYYQTLFSETQRLRHTVRPGISGLAQVNGRHEISWEEKFEMDLFYVSNISARLDLLIFFKTIRLLLSFKKDASLQEKPFKGSN